LNIPASYRPVIQYALLMAVVSYTAFLQFYRLGELPIVQWDESRLAVNAAEMYRSGSYLVSTYEGQPDLYNTKPPLMVWLQVASMHIFGLNETAVRFPSAMAGFICILLCGYIVYRNYRQLAAACLAMLLLACSKGFIQLHGSMTGDYDSMLALWLLLAFYHFYTGFISLEKKSSRSYFTICLAIAVMTKSAAALIAFPVFIVALLLRKNKEDFLQVMLCCALSLLPFIVFCLLREHQAPGYLDAIMKKQHSCYF
jgi:4-amino-4-deoxy-L-arabinose transferase-like glycosyltransferase